METTETPQTTEPEAAPAKFIKLTYLSEGDITVESSLITVFDLWSLSNYLRMRGDEMYINVLAVEKAREAAKHPLVVTGQMPRRPGKLPKLHVEN